MSASFSVIAERFRRAGQLDRAVALCQEGLAEFPDHLSARVTLGCALLDLGQYLDAHRELQMVIKRAPDNLAAIRGLAELHSRGFGEEEAPELTDEIEVESPLSMVMPEDAAPSATHELQALDELDALEELDEFDPLIPPNTLDTTDLVELAPMPFEIEDVIADAGDVAGRDAASFGDDLNELFDPEVEAMPAGDPGLHIQAPVVLDRPIEPLPVPELSSGPIAVLDEWLTRIRARRLELLSEYAAG